MKECHRAGSVEWKWNLMAPKQNSLQFLDTKFSRTNEGQRPESQLCSQDYMG